MSSIASRLLPLLLSTLALAACDEETDRMEHLKKLRALGVGAVPVAGRPSAGAAPEFAVLTFYASVPPGATVAAEPYVDRQAKYAALLPLAVVPGSEAYEDHNSLRIYTVQATLPLPPADQIALPPATAFARLRYGLRLTSGAEEELVVGNFLVYPAGAPELAWTAPTVDVTTPAPGAVVSGKEDLKAALGNPNDESLRIGWYVSDGALKNRRAKETEWETPGAGPHTVVATARGLKSGAFALKVVDVTVE